MVGVSIEFPHRDVAAIQRQMARAADVLKKSQPQAVRFGAWAVASSLGASTRVAKKKRPMQEIQTSRKTQRKFEVESYKSGAKKLFEIYARTKQEAVKSSAVRIGKHGMAKASWMWGIKAIGGGPAGSAAGASKSAKRAARQHIEVAKKLQGDNPSVRITNRLGYIMDALRGGPKDVSTAMERAAKQMAKIIDSKMPKGLFG